MLSMTHPVTIQSSASTDTSVVRLTQEEIIARAPARATSSFNSQPESLAPAPTLIPSSAEISQPEAKASENIVKDPVVSK